MRTVKVLRVYVEAVDDPDLPDFGVYPVTIPNRAQIIDVRPTTDSGGVTVTALLEP